MAKDKLRLGDDSVCIVIPVYNCEKYIGKCLKSIVNQTYENWLVVAIDDGSKDKSGKILDKWACKDSRIRVIHQENKGSVEARKAGVLSNENANCKWLTFCDADDTLERNALQLLMDAQMEFCADMVVADKRSMYRGFKFPKKYVSPCFREKRVYAHDEVLKELLISYFGITDFPVTLYSKLYLLENVRKEIDFVPVVRFMGDDLSVSIRLVAKAEKIAIIPDTIYNYRIGGFSSKYAPDLLDDFVNLYNYKREYGEKYPMPQDWKYLMDVELVNVSKTCVLSEMEHDKNCDDRIEMICNSEEVRRAAAHVKERSERLKEYSGWILDKDVLALKKWSENQMYNNRWRRRLKKLLKNLM